MMSAPVEISKILTKLALRGSKMPDTANWPDKGDTTADILIVGTGFAGLAAAIRLQQAGFADLLLVESGDDVGGTWRDNQYPGCACDIPSHLYSLSFAPRADWSRMYPRQPELFDYLREVADQHNLRPKIRFNTKMTAATWDEAANLWRVNTSTGAITARVLISGIGGLHIPATPRLPGLETFQGKTFHSAQWDKTYDLTGKRVAVIGTGASAIQFVPQIAPLVEKLNLFQRTPPWIMPKPDREFSAREKKLFRFAPYRLAFRQYLFRILDLRVLSFLGNKRMQRFVSRMAVSHMHKRIADPALRAKLTPNYAVGCKRIMISNDYYPSLTRPNVELITDRIVAIRPNSIVDAASVERAVDTIIFGTGFEVTSAYRHTPIIGIGGRDLRALWDRTGLSAYKGIAVAGFPNYFILLGPHTALGHNSVVVMIEAQVNYVVKLLKQMRSHGVRAADVRPSVQDNFLGQLQKRLNGTVWQDGGCDSFYKDEHGRVTTIWPGSAASYRRATANPDLQDFHLLTTPAAITA
jgi:cation diffusion facilitator CzcD-associated flavoprotein CzcO